MLTLLLICLIKKHCRNLNQAGRALIQRSVLFLLLLILFTGTLRGQERVAHYNVLHDGEVKGWLVTKIREDGDRLHIKIESEIKIRFVVRITVKLLEEAIFDKGVLTYSALFRQVNGDVKLHQKTHSTGISYRVVTKGRRQDMIISSYPIHYSMLSLYCTEPVNVNRVYSDLLHEYAPVKKLNDNRYCVSLPNGNANYFTYTNGVCTNVMINQLYDVEVRLKQ